MGSSVLGLVSSTSSASYLHYAAATPALPASVLSFSLALTIPIPRIIPRSLLGKLSQKG